LPGPPQHRDGILDVLEHLVQGHNIELSEALDAHEIVGDGIDPGRINEKRRIPGDFRRATVPLAPRSAYRMTGEVRHDWEHSVPDQDGTRWSIMFRNLSDKGRRRLAAA